MRPPWARGRDPRQGTGQARAEAASSLAEVPAEALRSALGITAEAAGLPGALIKTLSSGITNETSALSFYAPRTIFNQNITGARRFAAQDWPLERIKAIGKATGTTINDVVLAMCSGALRAYLIELDALPDTTLVAMVPVGLNAKKSHVASAEGGNTVGALMVQARHRPRPTPPTGCRPSTSRWSTARTALESMTAGADPRDERPRPGSRRSSRRCCGMQGIMRPPFNLIISNVPGPRTTQLLQRRQAGRHLSRCRSRSTAMALNITCTSYDGSLGLRPHRLPPHGPPPAAAADPPRRRDRRAGEGSRIEGSAEPVDRQPSAVRRHHGAQPGLGDRADGEQAGDVRRWTPAGWARASSPRPTYAARRRPRSPARPRAPSYRSGEEVEHQRVVGPNMSRIRRSSPVGLGDSKTWPTICFSSATAVSVEPISSASQIVRSFLRRPSCSQSFWNTSTRSPSRPLTRRQTRSSGRLSISGADQRQTAGVPSPKTGRISTAPVERRRGHPTR